MNRYASAPYSRLINCQSIFITCIAIVTATINIVNGSDLVFGMINTSHNASFRLIEFPRDHRCHVENGRFLVSQIVEGTLGPRSTPSVRCIIFIPELISPRVGLAIIYLRLRS